MADSETSKAPLLTVDTNLGGIIDFSDMVPGVKSRPLFLDPENGTYVLYSTYAPGTRLAVHFHTGSVHFYTTKGQWHYLEYPDDIQRAGSYLYEPAGTTHTFCVPDDAEESAEGFMVVMGANIDFAADGSFLNITDAGWIERASIAASQSGGHPLPQYIRARGAAFAGG